MNSNQRRQKYRKKLRDWPVGAEVVFQCGYASISGVVASHRSCDLNTCRCRFRIDDIEYERLVPIGGLKRAEL